MDVSAMNATTMNTTTITADVECFNGLRDLFVVIRFTRYKAN